MNRFDLRFILWGSMNNQAKKDIVFGLFMVIITAPFVIGLSLDYALFVFLLAIPLALGIGFIMVALIKGKLNESDYIREVKNSDEWGYGY